MQDERARARLAEAGYHELQQALRRRAPPKPAAPALVLGATAGIADLPGPLAPMPAAVRDPAVLSEADSSEPPTDDEEPGTAADTGATADAGTTRGAPPPAPGGHRYMREGLQKLSGSRTTSAGAQAGPKQKRARSAY